MAENDPTVFSSDPRRELPPRSTVAVAVKTDGGTEAPRARVVAKGRGAVAEQIVQLAFANGVKVREDADLAETLHAVDLDCDVPLEAVAAVAEILTYVYRANSILAEGRSEGAGARQP